MTRNSAALDQPADELRKRFLTHQARQHLDEADGRLLARIWQGGKNGLDCAGPEVPEPRYGLLRDGAFRVRR
jgi:hypothetical protein